jgi:hypothetical protein
MTKAQNTLTILNALSAQFGYDVNLKTAMTFIKNIDICIAPDPVPADPSTFALDTHEGRVAFVMQGEARTEIDNDRKIVAIKVLRTAAKCGLIEAKDAVDEAARKIRDERNLNQPF